MANDPSSKDSSSPASKANAFDMSEFMHVFIDESAEELDQLVDSVLILERDPQNPEALQKAFRMLHTLKGSCGIMGFDVVGSFAHSLEDRFESYRAGLATLDEAATTLILKSIDYFRTFIDRLRTGTVLEEDPANLQEAWDALSTSPALSVTAVQTKTPQTLPLPGYHPAEHAHALAGVKIIIRFREGLQLADLKARLIMSRLSTIGEVVDCFPPIEDTDSFDDLTDFAITFISNKSRETIKQIAEVEGVESIKFLAINLAETDQSPDKPTDLPIATAAKKTAKSKPVKPQTARRDQASSSGMLATATGHSSVNQPASDIKPSASAAVTLRVDTERLDSLMNLTGELVIATAHLQQIAKRLEPDQRGSRSTFTAHNLTQRLRQFLDAAKSLSPSDESQLQQWHRKLTSVEADLSDLDNQAAQFEETNSGLRDIRDALDQLAKVSKSLQRGVLQTRMVPIAPLFNRFKRLVRDLSVASGKQVHLVILGEKTELDKRMIDALGDPLLHIMRNCIDHGIESPTERLRQGKHEVSTLTLHASHRGNSVLIEVSDDGAGISIEKIKRKIIDRKLATQSQLSTLPDASILEFIWQPGFSTADTITDISGRGVGLDIVRESIGRLNGTVEAVSRPGEGTTFSLRLPLTLAIIHSLIIRIRGCCFSIPMDDIREIVSVKPQQIHTLQNCQTIEFRDEWIAVASLDKIFSWNLVAAQSPPQQTVSPSRLNGAVDVVVVQTGGRTLGLCVDELVGRSDIVIKSLAENYTSIPGLSGASILGDGQVCLMLDTMTLIELANQSAANSQS